MAATSWYFDGFPLCDERQGIERIADGLELGVEWIRGDDHFPLCEGFTEGMFHDDSPWVNAFAALKQRLYDRASELGCKVMMVGDGGDAMYMARGLWLWDLWSAEGAGSFLKSAAGTVRRASRGDSFARTSLRNLIPLRNVRRLFGRHHPAWLTGFARELQEPPELSPIVPGGPMGHRYELSIGARYSELESEEQRLFGQCGLTRCNPYWSWPLLESVLNLPASWYHRDGVNKILARTALRGRSLPSSSTISFLEDLVVADGLADHVGPILPLTGYVVKKPFPDSYQRPKRRA